MKNGDAEFHQRTEPILAVIAEEGLKTARENRWPDLLIEIIAVRALPVGGQGRVRCSLRSPMDASAIDEPSARLVDAAEELQSLFAGVDTPLKSVRIDWVDEGGDGKRRRRCRFEYA